MEFRFNEYAWQSDVHLPGWSDFIDGDTVVLTFAPEGRDDSPMTADEIALAGWVADHYEMQKPFVLNAILAAYPEMRRQYFEDYNIAENEEDLPTINSIDDLSKVLALQEVNVHHISNEGVPYVGYQFSCDWDEEHGLGVLMNDIRVVEVGGAETAFVLWIAKRDRET